MKYRAISLVAALFALVVIPAVAKAPTASIGAYGNLTSTSFISLALIENGTTWTQYPGGVGWNSPEVGYFTGGLGTAKPVFIAGHAMVHLVGKTMAGKSATCDIDETNDGIGVTVKESTVTVYSKAFGSPTGPSPAKLSVTAPSSAPAP